MKTIYAALMVGFAMMTSACSTIVEGSDQNLVVDTDPSGAACELMRDGMLIGKVDPTPGVLRIDKSSQDIVVDCTKDDLVGQAIVASDVEDMTFGNILAGGIIGVAVDGASGAMYVYPESVTIPLLPSQ